jgi:peptidoglycan hydrolase CwlO-like protein
MEDNRGFSFGEDRGTALVYGGVALGLVAGAAISTYVWRQRVKAASELTPLQRAEKMIEACEKKLENIEKSVQTLQDKGASKKE